MGQSAAKTLENLRLQTSDIQSEEDAYFNQFMDSSVVMLLLAPENGKILGANDAAIEFYGYTREELLTMEIFDINISAPREELQAAMHAIKPKEGGRFEFKHRLADGSTREIASSTSRIRFGERMILHSIIHDVTDRKRAEASLKDSEERYRLLMDNAIVGIATHEMIFDNNGVPIDYKFLNVNAAFEEQTGLKAEDVLGKRVTEVIPGIEETLFIEIYGKVVTSGKPICFNYYAAPLDRHYHIHAYKLNKTQFAAVFDDITERRKAEESLKENESFLNLLIETTPVPVFYMDSEGRFVMVNKAFEKLFWKERDQIIGKTYQEIKTPEEAHIAYEQNAKLLEKAGTAAYYSKVTDGLGLCHDVIFQKASVVDKRGKVIGIVGAILDVTEKKDSEKG